MCGGSRLRGGFARRRRVANDLLAAQADPDPRSWTLRPFSRFIGRALGNAPTAEVDRSCDNGGIGYGEGRIRRKWLIQTSGQVKRSTKLQQFVRAREILQVTWVVQRSLKHTAQKCHLMLILMQPRWLDPI